VRSTEVVNTPIPTSHSALSSCTHDVLTEFIRDGATTVRCDAGETLATLTARDQNLYVLISGTAILRAPMTYITWSQAILRWKPEPSVPTLRSVVPSRYEFMVISPGITSSYWLHPDRHLKIEWS